MLRADSMNAVLMLHFEHQQQTRSATTMSVGRRTSSFPNNHLSTIQLLEEALRQAAKPASPDTAMGENVHEPNLVSEYSCK